MTSERLSIEEMTDVLAEWLAAGTTIYEEDRRRAAEALSAIGIPSLLADLALAERVLRMGNGFHTIAGFFTNGSPEQDFLLALGDAVPGPNRDPGAR